MSTCAIASLGSELSFFDWRSGFLLLGALTNARMNGATQRMCLVGCQSILRGRKVSSGDRWNVVRLLRLATPRTRSRRVTR